jgi:hypothetical protein
MKTGLLSYTYIETKVGEIRQIYNGNSWDNSSNCEADEKNRKWLRLTRLLQVEKFTFCSAALAIFIAMFFLVQLLLTTFYPLLGGNLTRNAFTFVKLFFQILLNVLNYVLLDHIPVVVKNRYKYQQPLPKPGTKVMLLKTAAISRERRKLSARSKASEAEKELIDCGATRVIKSDDQSKNS